MGRFLNTAPDGSLISDVDKNSIAPDIWDTTKHYLDQLIKALQKEIHSIYLVGSVPRGLAEIGRSDLDLVVLLPPDSQNSEPIIKQISEIASKTKTEESIFSKVDVEVWKWDWIFSKDDSKRYEICRLALAVNGLCVWGESVIEEMPKFFPNKDLASIELLEIENDIIEARKEVSESRESEKTKYWCKRISKNIIRADFSLFIEKLRKFSRDIDVCFNELWQERHDPRLKQLKKWIDEPVADKKAVLEMLDTYGSDLVSRARKWLSSRGKVKK